MGPSGITNGYILGLYLGHAAVHAHISIYTYICIYIYVFVFRLDVL